MAQDTLTNLVFDHDDSTLKKVAIEADFEELVVSNTVDRDEVAAKSLLEKNWHIACLHIEPEPWKMLCEKLPTDRVLIRFSTQGYAPSPQCGLEALALHCQKKTTDLSKDDLLALKTVCCNPIALESLRNRIIPQSIRHLIAFEEPHCLRALHILLQGVLAYWAADPGHESGWVAQKLLGVSSFPSLPNSEIIKCRTLWRGLGLETWKDMVKRSSKDAFCLRLSTELSIKTIDDMSTIKLLINHVFDSKSDAAVDPDKVFRGFSAIDNFLLKS